MVDIAKGMEAATRDTQDLQWQAPSIRAIQSSGAINNSGTVRKKPCHHYGKKNHLPHQCHFKDAVCHKCSKRGHIAKVCRASKPKRDAVTGGKQHKKIQWVQADDTSDSETELPVLKVSSRTSHPIQVEMKIHGKVLHMEVDTGVAVSIISEQIKHRLFSNIPLKPPSVVLHIYIGEALSVLGEMEATVEYKDQGHDLTVVVVKGDEPSLFGRDWLSYFQLD